VLNKVDRLIGELKLSAEDAYHHIRKVLEQVNGLTGLLFKEHLINTGHAGASSAESAGDGEVTPTHSSGSFSSEC
jgi:ribosome assembly protein 1